MARPTLTPEALLEQYPPPTAALANELRRLVSRLQPSLSESVYPGWRAFGYRDADAGYVCGVFLADDAVKLLFEHGHLLPDPEGILEGTTKQTRHITIHPGDMLPEAPIATLLDAAIDLGKDIKDAR